MKPVRTYLVAVKGYGEGLYSARSNGAALGRAYRAFQAVCQLSYRDFMKVASARRANDPPGCGERIIVNGETVTRCFGVGSPAIGIYYMKDDSDRVLVAHPLEVEFPGKVRAA